MVYQAAMGVPQNDNVTFPPDPIQQDGTYQQALSDFEKLPEVRVLFDSGAGASPTGDMTPGNPYPGFTATFPTLPVPGTTARTWYFGAHGSLNSHRAAKKQINWYRSNPKALPLNDYADPSSEGGGLWGDASQWQWTWKPNPAGTAVSYVSSPLTSNTTVVGAGAVHVWVRASQPIVDLQATISEVRPDGNETFVQNGYLRSSWRKLSTGSNNFLKEPSTLLDPIPSARAKDLKKLPEGQVRRSGHPPVLRGARISSRIPHPGDHRGAQRRPAGMGIQPDQAGVGQDGQGMGGLLQAHALESGAARGARGERDHRASPLPQPAQRALPDLRSLPQPYGAALRLIGPAVAPVGL